MVSTVLREPDFLISRGRHHCMHLRAAMVLFAQSLAAWLERIIFATEVPARRWHLLVVVSWRDVAKVSMREKKGG